MARLLAGSHVGADLGRENGADSCEDVMVNSVRLERVSDVGSCEDYCTRHHQEDARGNLLGVSVPYSSTVLCRSSHVIFRRALSTYRGDCMTSWVARFRSNFTTGQAEECECKAAGEYQEALHRLACGFGYIERLRIARLASVCPCASSRQQ